jgi:hypothetical protein
MEAVRVLSEEIGPRPPCSGAEARAARWCAGRLAEAGLEVELETFESRRTAHITLACYLLAGAVGAVLAVPVPLLGFVIGMAALVLYARDTEGRPLAPVRGASSVNVVARAPTRREPELVVVAQLDSARATVTAGPGFGPGRRGWAIVVHGALLLVPVIGAAAWVAEAGRPLPAGLWTACGLIALPLFAGALVEIHTEKKMSPTSGANDSASAVEIVMRLAHRFHDERIWWVLLGSGHSGNIGMRAFLALHDRHLGSARVLNLIALGDGRVSAATDEGVFRLRRADGALIDAAVEAGAESSAYRVTQSAAAVAIVHHRRALSLVGLDEHGAVPHQAWTTDIASNVDPSAIDRAEDVAARVIAVTTGAIDHAPARRRSIDGTSQT